jgi:hypothetical protein
VRALELEGRPALGQQLSITWLRFESSLIGRAADWDPGAFWTQSWAGASWGGEIQRYPASVVKAFYMAAAEAWVQADLIEDSAELRLALEEMVRDSSNDATGLVVDLLSGTTSGPALPERAMADWVAQRQLVNGWLSQWAWPELEGANVCQKTWGDGPFGRERVFYGSELENRNRLSTDLTARLLLAVMASALISPPACARMRALLERSLEAGARAADPDNQVDGFLGEGLPAGSRLWSKAGWMSQARHDAAYVEAPGHRPFVLVVFSEGPGCAQDPGLLPEIATRLAHASCH